jgi:hypothetical protein
MRPSLQPRNIEIVAAMIRDEQGHALLVRKRGAEVFQQPGIEIVQSYSVDSARRQRRFADGAAHSGAPVAVDAFVGWVSAAQPNE